MSLRVVILSGDGRPDERRVESVAMARETVRTAYD